MDEKPRRLRPTWLTALPVVAVVVGLLASWYGGPICERLAVLGWSILIWSIPVVAAMWTRSAWLLGAAFLCIGMLLAIAASVASLGGFQSLATVRYGFLVPVLWIPPERRIVDGYALMGLLAALYGLVPLLIAPTCRPSRD
jgi:hypothetical protein